MFSMLKLDVKGTLSFAGTYTEDNGNVTFISLLMEQIMM